MIDKNDLVKWLKNVDKKLGKHILVVAVSLGLIDLYK